MVPVHERYKHYRAPRGVRKSVVRLLRSLPPGHLSGLQAVVLTNSRSVGKGKTRRVAGRKYNANECRGFYYPAQREAAPWIEIIVDNIIPLSLPWYLRWRVTYDMLLSDTLFHEVGHHLDHTIGSPARNGEAAADSWSTILRRRYFRDHHRWLPWLTRILSRIFSRRLADLNQQVKQQRQSLRRA